MLALMWIYFFGAVSWFCWVSNVDGESKDLILRCGFSVILWSSFWVRSFSLCETPPSFCGFDAGIGSSFFFFQKLFLVFNMHLNKVTQIVGGGWSKEYKRV